MTSNHQRMSASLVPMLGLMLFALCIAGCGYTHKTVFPTDVRSVQVSMFENRTFYRGLEFDLTEALIKEIELRTPYKAVSNDAADTTLKGTIINVKQVVASRRRSGGLPQEMELQVTVDFIWRNQRTGKIITDRQGLMVAGRYLPALGETLSAGEHETAQKLATQIVSAMAEQW